MNEYPLTVRADPAFERGGLVRVYDLAHIATIHDFQEVATMARFMANIRLLFSYNTARAAAARGTPEQITLVDWLFKDLDRAASPDAPAQPGRDSAAHEYRLPGTGEIVRVFYLTHNQTPQQIEEIATQIRAITRLAGWKRTPRCGPWLCVERRIRSRSPSSSSGNATATDALPRPP
jgi:hypothetical protein